MVCDPKLAFEEDHWFLVKGVHLFTPDHNKFFRQQCKFEIKQEMCVIQKCVNKSKLKRLSYVNLIEGHFVNNSSEVT